MSAMHEPVKCRGCGTPFVRAFAPQKFCEPRCDADTTRARRHAAKERARTIRAARRVLPELDAAAHARAEHQRQIDAAHTRVVEARAHLAAVVTQRVIGECGASDVSKAESALFYALERLSTLRATRPRATRTNDTNVDRTDTTA